MHAAIGGDLACNTVQTILAGRGRRHRGRRLDAGRPGRPAIDDHNADADDDGYRNVEEYLDAAARGK